MNAGNTESVSTTRAINPASIRAPYGNYSHGLLVPPGARLLFCSGQVGVSPDDTIPAGIAEQTDLCFRNVGAILREAGMDFANVIRLGAFLTSRDDRAAYMAVRDRYVTSPPPASTLLIVSGFALPEFLVEVEIVAAA